MPPLQQSDCVNAGWCVAVVFGAAVPVGVRRASAAAFQPAAAVLKAGAAASAVGAFGPSALVAHDVAEAVAGAGLPALPEAFAGGHCFAAD